MTPITLLHSCLLFCAVGRYHKLYCTFDTIAILVDKSHSIRFIETVLRFKGHVYLSFDPMLQNQLNCDSNIIAMTHVFFILSDIQ